MLGDVLGVMAKKWCVAVPDYGLITWVSKVTADV